MTLGGDRGRGGTAARGGGYSSAKRGGGAAGMTEHGVFCGEDEGRISSKNGKKEVCVPSIDQ